MRTSENAHLAMVSRGTQRKVRTENHVSKSEVSKMVSKETDVFRLGKHGIRVNAAMVNAQVNAETFVSERHVEMPI